MARSQAARELAVLLLASALGCGGAPATSDSGSEGELTAESESESTTAAPWEPTPARGISITEVEANPGVGIPIALGADWVDAGSRNARLPRDRDTLIRVQHTVDEGWIPREIEARLILNFEDGTSTTLSQTKVIEGSSNPDHLDGAFFFGMTAEEGHVQPGVSFQVQLWEVAEGGEALVEGVHTSPATPSYVGIEAAPMEMNIMFVPFIYNGQPPDVSEEDEVFMVENGLIQHNPLQSVHYEWHEPIEITEPLAELGDLLPILAQMRVDEGHYASNWYYAGLISTGGNSLYGTKGIARRVGPVPVADRVSATVWNNTGSSTDTLVHEVGHNQSFQHVFCEGGGADNVDPTYKNESGELGNYGFGIRDYTLRKPDGVYEYMTYCDPSWVSDWTWNKAYYTISTVTAWDYEDMLVAPPREDVLKAIVYENGHATWWVGPGSMDAEATSANYRFAFDLGDRRVERLARAEALPDSSAMWLEVPLGSLDPTSFVGVRVRTPTYEATVERSEIAARIRARD